MMKGFLPCLGGLLFAGAAFAQDLPVGDPVAGRKVAGQCRTCHGLDGFARIPIAPHIGGESAAYLAAQLQAFRDGSRAHEMMTVVASSLSDDAIADVSAWYAQHQATATLTADEAEAPQACVSCHGANGIAVMEGVPNLAGETNIYLVTQLKAFRSGKRTNDIMTPISAELTDTDMRILADWYAGVALDIIQVD